jgi:hypothetical protein
MDVQTEKSAGAIGNYGEVLAQLPAALALHPDVVVTVIAPFDLEKDMVPAQTSTKPAPPPPVFSVEGIKATQMFVK